MRRRGRAARRTVATVTLAGHDAENVANRRRPPMPRPPIRTGLLAASLVAVCVGPAAAQPKAMRATLEQQFARFDPDYVAHRDQRRARLDRLAAALGAKEAQGHALHCSTQMFLEAKHLIRYTALWAEIDEKLDRLETSLADENQDWAALQSPVDGHWGLCYERDFMRLAATVVGLQQAVDRGEEPRYRVRVLPGLATPKMLLDRLQTLLISDVAREGVDNRGELASLLISLSQSVYKRPLAQKWNETIDLREGEMLSGMGAAFRFFLAGAQDPDTGYWGAWYMIDNEIVKTADLSFTYHVVAYTRGRIDRWPEILDTTWATALDDYPYGWAHDGRWNNHNLYDVARMLRYGWPHMDDAERARWRAKIAEMIEWSLRHTIEEGGAFRHDPRMSDSLAAEYYFGISFLDTVGYFWPPLRFWSDSIEFEPETIELCFALTRSLDGLGGGGWHRDAAQLKLARSCTED
jgi:hypothetical protein